jgi:amino acid adenylation domain-containing protein
MSRPPHRSASSAAGIAKLPSVGARLRVQLLDLARSEADLADAALVVLATLVHRHTGDETITIEVSDLSADVGATAAVRVAFDGDPCAEELVTRVRAASSTPFAAPGVEPLARFTFHDVRAGRMTAPNTTDEVRGVARAVELVAEDDGQAIRVTLRRPGGEARESERWRRRWSTLLAGAAAQPRRPVSQLPLLDAVERAEVLEVSRPPAVDLGSPATVHGLFEARARRVPDAIALVHEAGDWSFARLDRAANRLARHLARRGVGPGVRVGIYADRSPEMVLGLLATLKSGAAYVPLDSGYPQARIAYILGDARVRMVLTQRHLAADLAPPSERVTPVTAPGRGAPTPDVLALDVAAPPWAEQPDHPLEPCATAADVAYVIYTSGSTGWPKGVVVPHAGLVNYLRWCVAAYEIARGEGAPVHSSIAFDLTVTSLLAPLVAGRPALLLAEAEGVEGLARCLRSEVPLSLVKLTPSHLELLAQQLPPGGAGRARAFVIGGEALTAEALAFWRAHAPATRLVNEYGPTETVVGCCVFTVPPGPLPPGPVPIGRPIANAEMYVLDRHFEPVPPGVKGEIHIGGAGLAYGYLGQPALTAEKFVPSPFSRTPGARLYRTGDLGRRLPGGDIEYLGRLDDQVKIRGHRVELEEVVAAIRQQPGVADATLVFREDASGSARLVAYVVPRLTGRLDIAALRAALEARLPAPMVPPAWMAIDALPLTPNGKVDRRALPAPPRSRPDTGTSYVAPRTRSEAALAAIWAELLGVEAVGVRDDFVALGGHSLLAARVVARARAVLGVPLPLRAVLEARTVEGLARRGEELGPREAPARIAPARRDGPLPLSCSQERLFFVEQLHPSNVAYSFRTLLPMAGRLDVATLERTLTEIVRRHEVFRTTFEVVDGRAVQVIHPPWPVVLPVVDLSERPAAQAREEALRLADEEFKRPFDLSRLPLIRWAVLRFGSEEHTLVHVEHHLIHDGWSYNVFLTELQALYTSFAAGRPSPLPELPIQFADFAAWQRRWLEGEEAAAQLAYWKARLAGSAPLLELPITGTRPAVQTFRGALDRVPLHRDVARSARAFSRREGVTLFTTMLAAFKALLHRYTGQGDILVGTGVANRRAVETEPLIGMVINNLVLRTQVSGDLSFRALLERVRAATLEAYEHQDLPFDKVVEALHPQRDLGHNPLVQAMFSFHDSPMPSLELPGLRIASLDLLDNGSAKFDLNVIAIPEAERRVGGAGADNEGLDLIWEYNSDLLSADAMARMRAHYEQLLAAAVAHPDQRISELPLLTGAERERIVVEWNRTEMPDAATGTVIDAVERQAAQTPDALAVSGEGRSLRYGELDAQSNRLAHRLRRLGVRRGDRVAVVLRPGPLTVVAYLGVLKAEAAYLPVDVATPARRVSRMLDEAQVAVVLTETALAAHLDGRPAEVMALDEDGRLDGPPLDPPSRVLGGDDLAYVIHTSGSTGSPKGVMVPHRGLSNLIAWHVRTYGVTAADRATQVAGLAFDAAVWEIWPYLTRGASLHVPPEEIRVSPRALLDWMAAEEITLSFLPTPLAEGVLEAIAHGGAARPRLRTMLTGGDRLHAGPAQELPFALVNHYGPTENSVVSTCAPVGAGESSPSIGRPIANSRAYILDSHLAPVPIGVAGEIHVGGAGLARGYLARPELTAAAFVPDPFGTARGARLYRTGDRARFLLDGRIEFLGRVDDQVKIRGFRVEPGEVECTLAGHPAVREAVVVARGDGPDIAHLCAYVVLQAGGASADLRGFLKERLPSYMVPRHIVTMEALPLTANGKVDRAALPAPAVPACADEGVARTADETELARLWAELLGRPVGWDENFFDAGGHSLLAARLAGRVRTALDVDLSVRHVFESPTLRELSAVVEGLRGQAPPAGMADLLEQVRRMSPEDRRRALEQARAGRGKR